ncbi:hypothetical protein WDU94_012454 [Cyamophila willieti]
MYVDDKTLYHRLDQLSIDEMHYVRFMSGDQRELIPYVILYLEKKKSTFGDSTKLYVEFLRRNVSFTQNQWNLLRNVCRTCLPESSDTAYGVLIAQNYLEPRQQGNLNSAKSTSLVAVDIDGISDQHEPPPTTFTENGDDLPLTTTSGQQIFTLSNYPNEECMTRCRQCMDTIKEVGVLGAKGKSSTTVVTSLIVELSLENKRPIRQWLRTAISTNYANIKNMYQAVYRATRHNLIGSELREIAWYLNPETDEYVVRLFLFVYTPGIGSYIKYRNILLIDDDLNPFTNVPGGLSKAPKLYEIFSSAKTITDVNDCTVFVQNFVVCLYCCITGRHKPAFDSVSDGFLFAMLMAIATMMYTGGSPSLKRNGMVQAGYGPLIFAIAESGLHEMERHMNTYPTAMAYPLNSAIEQFLLNTPLNFNATSNNCWHNILLNLISTQQLSESFLRKYHHHFDLSCWYSIAGTQQLSEDF